MKQLRREIQKLRVEVMFVTETHLSAQKERDVCRIFRDYDVLFRSRKEKEVKQYTQRGGILCIAKKGTVKVRPRM